MPSFSVISVIKNAARNTTSQMDLDEYRKSGEPPRKHTRLELIEMMQEEFEALKTLQARRGSMDVSISLSPNSAVSVMMFEWLISTEGYDAYTMYGEMKHGFTYGVRSAHRLTVDAFQKIDVHRFIVTFIPKGATKEEIEAVMDAELKQ